MNYSLHRIQAILLAILCFSCMAFGQSSTLIGTVSEYADLSYKLFAKDAEVVLTGNGWTKTITVGEDGYFEFTDLEPGYVELKVNKKGRWPFEEMLELKPGENVCFVLSTYLSKEGEEFKPISMGGGITMTSTGNRYTSPKAVRLDTGVVEIETNLFLVSGSPSVNDGKLSLDEIPDKALEKLKNWEGVNWQSRKISIMDSSLYEIVCYDKGVFFSRK